MLDSLEHRGRGAKGESRTARVAVIGAGISGLVTAKVLGARGFEVAVLERSRDLGGVWEPARSYPGVQTQTPGSLYAFTDLPMPGAYPEWPTGAQMHAYLCDYARRFDLRRLIRFGTEVSLLSRRPDAGWEMRTRGRDGIERSESYDVVVVASGQFSAPQTLDLPGTAAFTKAGGIVRHSSDHVDGKAAAGKDVVVVGFSKSATDIAMNALDAKARSVTVVYRETSWKLPYFFGNLVNFKNILYCRASEAMFMPWAPSRTGRMLRTLAAPLIWANWRALEALLTVQFGLRKLGLRPAGRIEDSIHCSTSIETPGFYKAIHDGRIKLVRGSPTALRPGALLVDAIETKADLVVLAIGWKQELPFLDAPTREALVAQDGLYRLHRMIINPDLPGLAFIGFNSSFITTLSAELGANWLACHLTGTMKRRPTDAQMRRGIENQLDWKRRRRKAAAGYGGLCVAPYHHAHFDELMTDMGLRRRSRNPLSSLFLPISPTSYGRLLAAGPVAAPAPEQASRKETSA